MTNMPDPTPLTPEQIAALEQLYENSLKRKSASAMAAAADSLYVALRSAAPALIASAKALAKAQAKADECEVDWEVWNTENTRLQSALAAAERRGEARGLREAQAIYREGTVSGDDRKSDWWDVFGAYVDAVSARLAEIEKENGHG